MITLHADQRILFLGVMANPMADLHAHAADLGLVITGTLARAQVLVVPDDWPRIPKHGKTLRDALAQNMTRIYESQFLDYHARAMRGEAAASPPSKLPANPNDLLKDWMPCECNGTVNF